MCPLINGKDKLTGRHANTESQRIIGLEEVAALTGNQKEDFGVRFFWDTVVKHRSVAFGGNGVSEHFNAPTDFSRLIEHREGPEACNTYDMLQLTEALFVQTLVRERNPDGRQCLGGVNSPATIESYDS